MNRRKVLITGLAGALATGWLGARSAFADKPDHAKGKAGPPGLAKRDGTPPGLAKKGGLPPGLAKKYGRPVAAPVYVAVDPRHDDRAWFLIDGRWVLRQGFDSSVRTEVRWALSLDPVRPPVPLPSARIDLRVVVFG